ncbi:MAG TPA: S41 family peptidase [Thermoanaerobaculia bacterium]|nr:S41 family peptidase [Thermoanaerobaculia bacterium]
MVAVALLVMLGATTRTPTPTPPLPPVLAEVDRIVREGFWDPKLKGVDWKTAVARAARELAAARTPSERDAVYDALLAGFQDSHTFRLPAGRIPPRDWGTAGLRIGAQGEGYVITGVIPGSPADRAGLRLGDRVLAVDGKPYGRERVNFRDLFLVFEGPVGSTLRLSWSRPPDSQPHEAALIRTLEEPGDALVWKSARIIRRDGKAYGYAHLWGLSAQTALAVVDLLLNREESAGAKPELKGWEQIEGFLLDVRANSGGYDPNILATFLRGRWSSGDYWLVTREARRLIPPEYRALPVALLVNSGTASAGEILALQFRRHGIGPIVGERTSGMASGGASPHALSDGSTLWLSSGSLEDTQGVSYEGRGIAPDVTVPDRPPAAAGEEDAVVEAAIRALAGAVKR